MANSSRIKGITIELDGNTTKLQKALSGVTQQSIDIQKELSDVQRLLKFDPGNVEALAQRQQLLAKQVENTTQKLNQLKEAESQVEQQFKSGNLGESQYRAFRREIEFTETELGKLKQSLAKVDDGSSIQGLKKDFKQVSEEAENAQEEVKGLGSELINLAAGAAAGIGISEIVEKSLDTSSLNTKIDVSFNVPEESKQSIKDAVNTVSSYGVDAEEALEGVRRQWALNKDASDESNQSIIEGAGAIATAYSGVDFTELILETNELAAGIEVSNEAALGLINSILKAGFPPEQLDTIAEYGQQMKDAGFNAQEIQAIFEKGIDTKSWNIDNLNDGVKEARINMASFGQEVPKSLSTLLEQTDVSAQKMQEWGKAVAEGGEGGSKAMGEMADWLANIDDKTLQNSLATEIFKTKWEDNGTNVLSVLSGLANATDKTEENMQGLNAVIDAMNSDPANKMAKSIADLITQLSPLFEVIANIVGALAGWISNNPVLAATITAIVATLGILIGIIAGLAPIITMVTGLLPLLTGGLAAIAAPVAIVIGVITALIAIGVALYANWETISTKAKEIFTDISTTISNSINSIITWFTELTAKISNQFTLIINNVSAWGNNIASWIATNIPMLINNIISFFSQLPNGIWTWLVNTVNNIKIWGSNMLTEATTGMKNVFNGIVDTFMNLPSKMAEIGTNIVAGIKEGISNAWEGMTGWIGGLCDSFTEGIKEALDIHSPSRVMRELGNFTGEGFGLGIGDTIGSISKQANAIAAAAIPNVNAGSFDMGVNATGGGIGSVSGFNEMLSVMSSMKDEIRSLKEAFNVTLNLDGQKVGKMITPVVSNNLAFNSGRKGF